MGHVCFATEIDLLSTTVIGNNGQQMAKSEEGHTVGQLCCLNNINGADPC